MAVGQLWQELLAAWFPTKGLQRARQRDEILRGHHLALALDAAYFARGVWLSSRRRFWGPFGLGRTGRHRRRRHGQGLPPGTRWWIWLRHGRRSSGYLVGTLLHKDDRTRQIHRAKSGKTTDLGASWPIDCLPDLDSTVELRTDFVHRIYYMKNSEVS